MLFGSIPTETWDILFTPSFWLFLALVVVLAVVERAASWIIRKTTVRLNLPLSVANNVVIAVRLILIVVGVTAALPLFGVLIPSELLVALTASLSTAAALFLSFLTPERYRGVLHTCHKAIFRRRLRENWGLRGNSRRSDDQLH